MKPTIESGVDEVHPKHQPIRGAKDRQTEADLFWEKMAGSGPRDLEAAGRLLRAGSRVRLRPRPGGDALDAALDGRVAVIEGIDEDEAGGEHFCVTLEDDAGWDLGGARHPARRFFFAPDELEPLDAEEEETRQGRVLVAGIGNVFFGDDGFGVAVAQRLLESQLPSGVEVADFGIRGMDLAYALGRPWDAAILVDAVPRGRPPGSLYLIEPEEKGEDAAPFQGHGMDPLAVLRLARSLGPLPSRVLLVGCEPGAIGFNPEEMSMALSPPVASAVERAAEMVLEVAAELLAARKTVDAKPRSRNRNTQAGIRRQPFPASLEA